MKVMKLGRTSTQRLAIMRNQATDLLMKGKIETTVARAKSLKSYVEKIITLAINSYEDVVTVKKGDREVMNDGPAKLAARRKMFTMINKVKDENGKNIDLTAKLFGEYADKYKDRTGGYTRILKLGQRRGDAAEMVILELV